MAILQGFIKTIKRRLTNEGYKWQSEKTSSQTVVMGDGTDNTDTAEKRFGAIKGLTSSTSVTDTGYALDATVGKKHEDSIAALNQSLSSKVNTTDSRLSDARTPKAHTHDDRYYTESEINTKLNTLVKNHIVVANKAESLTVNGNSDREYSFPFSLPSGAKIIAQLPMIYASGKGISIGRNINKDFTVLLWNNNSGTQNVGVCYYVVYVT